MKRDKSVTHDLDREIRNERTKAVVEAVCAGKVHVLTVGNHQPTLVLFESARDAYTGNEAMREEGWEVSGANDEKHKPPMAPLAFWVRHPSPFSGGQSSLKKGRVFPPDSPCPSDVQYAQHQNGIVFRRVDYKYSTYANAGWRAMSDYDGDGSEHSWSALNGSNGDASPMTEVFLPMDSKVSVENLLHPVWRAVEAVVTPERLANAYRSSMVVDLVYDAVVAALRMIDKE
jgi:hypothetical protein